MLVLQSFNELPQLRGAKVAILFKPASFFEIISNFISQCLFVRISMNSLMRLQK